MNTFLHPQCWAPSLELLKRDAIKHNNCVKQKSARCANVIYFLLVRSATSAIWLKRKNAQHIFRNCTEKVNEAPRNSRNIFLKWSAAQLRNILLKWRYFLNVLHDKITVVKLSKLNNSVAGLGQWTRFSESRLVTSWQFQDFAICSLLQTVANVRFFNGGGGG